jgi:hypothetical protein
MGDIKVQLNDGSWVTARNYQQIALVQFKNQYVEHDMIYDNGLEGDNKIKFTIKREENQRIYLIREDNTKMPIADWNDVQVFLLDYHSGVASWYDARFYQIWAYFDFVHSSENEKFYKTKNSLNLSPTINYTEIPIDGLEPDIIFRISRNTNGTLFYERNDEGRTRSRISDNKNWRLGYLGFYNRITSDVGMSFVQNPLQPPHSLQLTIPIDVLVEETDDEELMCVVCNTNKKNVKLLSCGHDMTCSACCKELLRLDGRVKCPLCRCIAVKIEKIEI